MADINQSALDVLHALDGDAFQEVVQGNLGREAPEELWAALLNPAFLPRTRMVLAALKTDVQTQLAAKAAGLKEFQQECYSAGDEGKVRYFARSAEVAAWRKKTMHFLRMLERRLAQVKQADLPRVATARAAGAAAQQHVPKRRAHNKTALFAFAYHVWLHRRESQRLGYEGEPHDLDLWDALDDWTVSDPYGEMRSLSSWVEEIQSQPDFDPPIPPEGAAS